MQFRPLSSPASLSRWRGRDDQKASQQVGICGGQCCEGHLPASNNYIFVGRDVGGLGLQHTGSEPDIQTVVQTVRMLSSSDLCLCVIATQQLLLVVHRTIHRVPVESDVDKFLSGSMEGPLANSGYSGEVYSGEVYSPLG